jgi:hypothetical protein
MFFVSIDKIIEAHSAKILASESSLSFLFGLLQRTCQSKLWLASN